MHRTQMCSQLRKWLWWRWDLLASPQQTRPAPGLIAPLSPRCQTPQTHNAKHLRLRCQMLDPTSQHCSQHRAQAAVPGWLQGSPEPSRSVLSPAFTWTSASSYKFVIPPKLTQTLLLPRELCSFLNACTLRVSALSLRITRWGSVTALWIRGTLEEVGGEAEAGGSTAGARRDPRVGLDASVYLVCPSGPR